LFFEIEQYERAREPFEQAVVLAPSDAELRYDLGVCYARLGNGEAARKQYDVLRTIDEARAAKLLAVLGL